MFSFFKKDKISVQSIVMPDIGWELVKNEKDIRSWRSPEETISMSVHLYNQAPDFRTMKEVDVLRNYYRRAIAKANGGIVQVDLTQLHDIDVVKTILKIPQGPSHVSYNAALTMPFRDCFFVFKVQTGPVPRDGMREAFITDYLFKTGFDVVNDWWVGDPYDRSIESKLATNLGEEEAYDSLLPVHFLSQARLLINEIEKEVTWGEEINKLPRFDR